MLRCTSVSAAAILLTLGCASAPQPAPEPEPITVVQVQNEVFKYSLTLKRPNEAGPGVKCSYGRATGSHFEKTYCRTSEQAGLESDAAREFFLEAMRNKN